MIDFVERVGAVIVSPRRAMRAAAAAPAGQGGRDVAWLIVLRLVAGETPRIARALVRGIESGPATGLSALLSTAGEVLPDVIGILIGAIAMALFAGRGRGERALDLAAYAWVPYLAVELGAALLFSALGHEPSAVARHVTDAIAVGWAIAVWAIGLGTAREGT
jgi:hypothetical protein